MPRPRVILLTLDSPDAAAGLWERGTALARRLNATLYVEVFRYGGSLARTAALESPELMLQVREELEQDRLRLEAAASHHRGGGAAIRVGAAWGAPLGDAICARAKALRPLAVLHAIAEPPGPERLLRTPLDWQLLRECPAPVALLSTHASTEPTRIIAALDPGNGGGKPAELNERVLRTAKAWARTFKAELHAVHAYQPAPVAVDPMGGVIVTQVVMEEMRRSRLAAFQALCDARRIPLVRRHFIAGRAADVLPAFASQSATDLVVLGTMERGFAGRALLGSTAERVLHKLGCDVLALKPKPLRTHKWVKPVATSFADASAVSCEASRVVSRLP